ncbi:MAG: amidohydrolase family protein [Candidatus Eisenbacteria bacterium]|nr:amidohydrolase family protein [Candidatus Eisenbacteria bacterium]
MARSVHAKTIYTGKRVIEDAYVGFDGTTITTVSGRKRTDALGSYEVVTPAFIDPHSHIGMFRAGEPAAESEGNEQMDSLMVLPDALDSIQMDDQAFRDSIEMGVLYSCVVPGSGNIIAGRSAVIRHHAKNTSDALVTRSGIKAALGYNPMSTVSWKGKRPSTRMGAAAILRAKLEEVRRKVQKYEKMPAKKRKEMTFSAEEELLRTILAGKERLRVHVHKIDDIALLVRLVDEYGLKVTVEHAGDVHQPEIYDELRKRKIPVVFGPVDSFAYKVELKHESWRNVRYLVESGVEYGLMTDHPVMPSRQLHHQTRWFIRLGLSRQEAVEVVTRRNAAVLGVSRILGTLEKGKWASFVCWNGDPFDLTAYPVAVFAEGELVFTDES